MMNACQHCADYYQHEAEDRPRGSTGWFELVERWFAYKVLCSLVTDL